MRLCSSHRCNLLEVIIRYKTRVTIEYGWACDGQWFHKFLQIKPSKITTLHSLFLYNFQWDPWLKLLTVFLRTQWKLTAFTFHSIKKNINRAYLFDSDTVCEPAVLVWTFLSSVICGPSLCKTTLATQATTGSGGWRGLERMMSNTFSTSMSKLSSSLLFGTTCRYLIK